MEKCQRCDEEGEDRRTLWMACFYAMDELGLPFEQCAIEGVYLEHVGERPSGFGSITIPEWKELPDSKSKRAFYTLRVCKGCRADWMTSIKSWFENKPDRNDPLDTGIYERHLGTNREVVKLTRKPEPPPERTA